MKKTRWYRTKKFWALVLTPVLLFFVVFYGLDPLVESQTRKALKLFEPAYKVTYDNATLQPLELNYALTHFKVTKEGAGGDEAPYIYVDKVEVGIYFRELLHRHLVGTIDVQKLRVNLIAAKQESQRQLMIEVPDFSDKLMAAIPLTIDRVEVRDGEIMFVDKSNEDFPRVWLHAIDATVENLATRAALARGEPTSVALSGKLQQTGELSVFLTADPLAKGLFFSGRATVHNFELNELSKVMASETGVTFASGTLDLFAELDCRGGQLTGGIKPLLKKVKVVQGKPGLGNALKTVLGATAVNILSDDVGHRDAVATVIPIRGDLSKPELQLWPAVLGAFRNAFVVGVSESFRGLPPIEAAKPQDPLKQVVQALDKNDSPKAQPAAEGAR